MQKLRSFFGRLQWKLAFSYALVSVVIVAILLSAFLLIATDIESRGVDLSQQSLYWSSEAFKRNLPQWLDDPVQMQKWLDRVQKEGFIEADYQFNIPPNSLFLANSLNRTAPIIVLDKDRKVLAASPRNESLKTGTVFDVEGEFGLEGSAVLIDVFRPPYGMSNYTRVLPDRSVLVLTELRDDAQNPDSNVFIPQASLESGLPEDSAIVIYQYKPIRNLVTSNLGSYRSYIMALGMMMLCMAVPMGLVFGWLASRSLRKRLGTLSDATMQWRTGDFSQTVSDQSTDEIGILTRNLNVMTEQLRSNIQTKDELVRMEERNKLARDLHDTVKQQTYAASMQLSAARNLLHTDPSAAEAHIDEAISLNRETQQEVKMIIDELRPPALDGTGLAKAIEEYLQRWQDQSKVEAKFTISGDRPLPMEIEQALYRVLQESLSNVVRHAQASLVKVALFIESGQVTLAVSDNGRGFDVAASSSGSFGLTGMRQRMASVHGTLAVESIEGLGTKLIAQAPIPEDKSNGE